MLMHIHNAYEHAYASLILLYSSIFYAIIVHIQDARSQRRHGTIVQTLWHKYIGTKDGAQERVA